MPDLDPQTVEELLRLAANQRDNSVQGFCHRNGLCRQTVYNEMNSGMLPFMKVGTRRLIMPEHEVVWKQRRSVNMGA